jgi:sulfhydrogenase subunit beta (sulfur reductase)
MDSAVAPLRRVLDREGLEALIGDLRRRGYRVVGPTVEDRAIVYTELEDAAALPEGWTDEQDGGTYRLRRRDDAALFGYASGPHSWKRYLFPPRELLWRAERSARSFEVSEPSDGGQPYAFVGVRACDLQAIAIQDRVFLQAGRVDPGYAARRAGAFIVAVNCGTPAGTCFCVSMGTGPAVSDGFDLALTELLDDDGHRFLATVGTDLGGQVLAGLPNRAPEPADEAAAQAVISNAAARMGRRMDTDGVKELLYRNYEHPRWDDVGGRCLSCSNCTMVCPTCFCSTVEDATDLSGRHAERSRRWDSCFTLGFSEMGGGHVRSSTRSRYRQWMTHKLASWIDQFGTSGCVGCGRCITWCPVGIDITEEVAAIRDGGRSDREAPDP